MKFSMEYMKQQLADAQKKLSDYNEKYKEQLAELKKLADARDRAEKADQKAHDAIIAYDEQVLTRKGLFWRPYYSEAMPAPLIDLIEKELGVPPRQFRDVCSKQALIKLAAVLQARALEDDPKRAKLVTAEGRTEEAVVKARDALNHAHTRIPSSYAYESEIRRWEYAIEQAKQTELRRVEAREQREALKKQQTPEERATAAQVKQARKRVAALLAQAKK